MPDLFDEVEVDSQKIRKRFHDMGDGTHAETFYTGGGLLSPFGDAKVVEKTPVIELASAFPISALRDLVSATGAATATSSAGEHRLATTASGTDAITVESAERGRYKPGYAAEAGIGMRLPVMPTGAQDARWGYFDDTDGVFFGADATGIFVARLNNSTLTVVRQADWNGDKLDGSGPSGMTLDLSRGNIFQILFTWYGYGAIEFEVLKIDAAGKTRTVTVHRMEVSGSVSIREPHLPVRASLRNNGTATAREMFIGGRQFSILGNYVPNERYTNFSRLLMTGIGTTATPVMSVRRKSGYRNVPVKLSGIDSILTGGDALAEIYLNATLTGASFGSPVSVDANETALEFSTSASALSGGNVIYSTLVSASGSGGNRQGFGSLTGLSNYIPDRQPVTLAVRALTGTVSVSVLMRMLEEW